MGGMGGTGVAPHSVPAKRAARRESLASSSEEGAALLGLSLQLARTGARRVWVTRRGGAREVWARRRPATEAREARGENGRERRAFAASATRGGRFAYVRDWRPCCAECCCAARWERRRGGRGGERGVGADDRDRCDARERFSWWKNRERRSMEGCPYVDDAFQTTPQISRDRVQEGAARRRRVANRWRQSCRGQRTPRRIQKRTRTRT